MSLSSLTVLSSPDQLTSTRKRTCSFSYPPPTFSLNPRPTKAPKTSSMGLSRTQSVIIDSPSQSFNSTTVAHYKALSIQRDNHRIKRKNAINRVTQEPLSINTHSSYTTIFTTPTTTLTPSTRSSLSSAVVLPPNPFSLTTKRQQRAPQVILPSAACPITTRVTHRTSSPLAPTPKSTTPRPVFPRSKPEPDLYKTALKGSLKQTPDGQRVLHMGARLAMSIFLATRELEKLVAMDTFRDSEADVSMTDSWYDNNQKDTSCSWVVVRGDDWEMVDCAS